MDSIQKIFPDGEGNHLLVALSFHDNDYKQFVLNIPSEYCYIEIADIEIEKAIIDKPIHFKVFFEMCEWLIDLYKNNNDLILTYICSFDDLSTNHPNLTPQNFRRTLFDRLYWRYANSVEVNIQDVEVASDEFRSFGRAFYHPRFSPIIALITSSLSHK